MSERPIEEILGWVRRKSNDPHGAWCRPRCIEHAIRGACRVAVVDLTEFLDAATRDDDGPLWQIRHGEAGTRGRFWWVSPWCDDPTEPATSDLFFALIAAVRKVAGP